MKGVAALLLVGLAGCSGWPHGSYVVLNSDQDAPPLATTAAEVMARTAEPGQSVQLIPSQNSDDVLMMALQRDLLRTGLTIAPNGAAHHLQVVTTPLDDGQMLRVVIDDKTGGGQFFARTQSGRLIPGGPWMEYQR